ncbi:conserved Plasmodium protein, unknown function [Plasmodium sp. DRC-Itaito]|nr:conserved Plasmodium protein, unknown function [Plasmodium sp. DRC-Itaito]
MPSYNDTEKYVLLNAKCKKEIFNKNNDEYSDEISNESDKKVSSHNQCYIIQEIPFVDYYNYKYETLNKYDEEKESYYINDDNTLSSSSSCSSNNCQENDSDKEINEKMEYNKSFNKYMYDKKNARNKVEENVKIDIKKYTYKKRIKEKNKNEFLKQCEFNKDGSCYYTISNSNNLNMFATDLSLLNFLQNNEQDEYIKNLDILYDIYNNMDEIELLKRNNSWLHMKFDEHLYDCKFYPYFEWNDSNSCFFSACSKNKPVSLYSAFDGSELMSFKPVNECNELCNCYSLCFHPEKNWLLCGTNKSIKVFDFNKPSETLENRILSTRKGKGQKGIISTMEYKNEGYGKNSIYAVGDYNDCLYIYADNCDHKNDYILKIENKKNSNGITCVKWYQDFFILSGSRNCSYIYLYDIRNIKEYIQKYERYALTNQQYLFDIYKDYLLCGDTFGYINIYNITNNRLINKYFVNRYSPIISINKHPIYPLLLTGSGTRRFYENNDYPIDIITNIISSKNIHIKNLCNISNEEKQENNKKFSSLSKYINSVCTILMDFLK